MLRSVRTGLPVTLGVDGLPRVADDPLSGLVGGSPEETAEATGLVEQARRHAEELVQQAIVEAEAIRRQAEQRGHAAGYERGSILAHTELAEALALVQRVAGDAKSLRDDLLRRSEHELIDLTLASLKAILGERVEQDRAVVAATVRRAIERAGSQNVVRIRVHPDEVERATAEVTDTAGNAPDFEVLADGSIALGGCVIDTAHGRVDARLDAQLDVIAAMLRDALPPLDRGAGHA